MMKKNEIYAIIVWSLLMFGLGVGLGGILATQDVVVTDKKPRTTTISSGVEAVTKTEIVYVPKESGERADMDIDVGKTDFTIRVNGKEQTFTKTDDEKFMFDKNKLSLSQTSRVAVDVNVPPIDKTKRWAVGVGASDNGIAYTVDFPIGKSDKVGGWAYKDNDSHAVGVKIKF